MGITGNVGVEQKQLHAADFGAPGAELDVFAGIVHGQADRHVIEVVSGIGLGLIAVQDELLAKITFLVEEADGHEGNAQVAGGFEVVAGQCAEPARVDGQRLRDGEFKGEVGDEAAVIAAVVLVIPGGAAEIGGEIPPNPLEVGEEGVVFGELFEAIFADHAEQADGVVAGVFLELSVDAPKKGVGVEVPAPPEVVAKLFERL